MGNKQETLDHFSGDLIMPIPDYQSLMLPVLEVSSDNQEHSLRETIQILANKFELSDSEKRELLPSGAQPVFDNRVGWARTYLKKAGLLNSTKRGFFKITDRGQEVLKTNPKIVNNELLKQFPEFLEFQNRTKEQTQETTISKQDKTPEELLEETYQEIRKGLAEDILSQVKEVAPSYFEKLVVDLLVRMGYGGSLRDAGRAIGKSGDEGIDGIIKEDRLGLDVIYLQAKRWEGTISRPEIQKFAGALQGQRAKKGIFITTSRFSSEALDFVSKIDAKIVLIDGEQLAELMIDHNLGVSTEAVYEVKRLDSDYFAG
jgi:restriction system protein